MGLRSALKLGIVGVSLVPLLLLSAGTAQAAAPADVYLADVTDNPDPASFGGIVVYSVPVGNRGPGTATAVMVTVQLPPGANFQAVGSSGVCAATGATVVCSLASLPRGSGTVLAIAVTVNGTSPLSLTFTATAAEPDRDPSNNNQTETTAVTVEADLTVNFGEVFGVVYAGQRFFVNLQLFNRGPAPATGIVVTLRIPAGLSTGVSSCVPDGDGLACTLAAGTLPPLSGGVLLVELVPIVAGDYTVTASATADQLDLFPETNIDSVAFSVTPAADVAVAIAESADPSPAGQALTYTMTITNRGPSPTTSVTLLDEWSTAVSGGVELLAVTTSQGSCAVTAPGRFGCELGTLAPGVAAIVTLQLRPRGVGTVSNRAEATAAEHDVDQTNNVASESTAIG